MSTAVRKTVTALFCDLVGSTAFGERVDAESSRDAMGRYFHMARTVVEAHGGTVHKFIGDGMLALFGVPEIAEDDAERAVRCGLGLQLRFAEIRDHIATRHGIDVDLRVGINTGEVVIADDDEDIVGDSLNTAARLEAASAPGSVLVGESTWRLTRATIDFGERREIRAKGKEGAVACYEAAADQAPVTEVVAPFVGRDDELRQLTRVLDETILERRARMVTVIGSPGVGKTRLARELSISVEGGTLAFELRCEQAGTATFAPIAELLRTVAGITDAHPVEEIGALVRATVAELHDADRVGELLAGFVGAGPTRSTEEMFFAVRRLFEVLGADQPVVLVVDDVQWAEPLFLDLLEHLAEWVQSVPLLVVGLARPEIREIRPVITEAGRRVVAVVNLEGLSDEATSELAAKLVGADSLPGDLLAKIPESTEGNPLFVRELMRMLVDDGVIANRSGRWEMVIDVDAVEVPTINSLLASRVERMAPDERRVLELASVVGSEFPVGAVEAAAADQTRTELDVLFERLRRKELIEPTGTYWGDEPVFRFHHVLIRDAAYRRLLKGARAELHVVVGDWTERSASSLLGEHEVTIAHHFEQAYHYRRQLDVDDDTTRALGERAAGLLATAAHRALARDDLAAAGSLAERALGCMDGDSAGVADLLLVGCEALLGTRNVAAGAPLVDRLERIAVGDSRLEAWVECYRAELTISTDPDGLREAEQRADAAARRLDDLGDQAGVAKARLQRAAALARLGRIGDCEGQLDLALSAARTVDDHRRVTAVLGAAPVAALWGPSPVPRAGGRCLDVVRLLRITTGSPAVEATSIRCQAVLEALRGRADTARTMLATARQTLEELGLGHGLLETELYAGLVELLDDDPVAAEPLLRQAYLGLGRMGIGADAGQAAAHLARALLLQGRLDEADALAAESDALAGQNPQTAIISRSVQAEVLAARGEHAEAVAMAEEAVQMAAGTDILVDHANAVASLARVLDVAGDAGAASTAAAEAADLYEQKGATVSPRVTSAPSSNAATMVEDAPPRSDGPGGNTADRLARAAMTAVLRHDADMFKSVTTPDIVNDDRRAIVGSHLVGWEQWERLYFSTLDPDLTFDFETIALRADHLSLLQVSIRDDEPGRSVSYDLLVVGRSHGERLDLGVTFEGDGLIPALIELDRLYAESLDQLERLQLMRLSDHMDAVHRKDHDQMLAAYSPHLEAVDHRLAAWPRQGYGEFAERTHTLLHVSESIVGFAESIFALQPCGVGVFMQVFRFGAEDGSVQVSKLVTLSVTDAATGLGVRLEYFDEHDIGSALARLEDVTLELEAVSPRPNAAVIIGGVVNSIVRGGAASFTGLVADTDRLLADPRTPFGVTDRRVLAVYADRVALLEVQLAGGEWVFSVEELDEDGLLADWRVFACDQLVEAAAEFGARSVAQTADDPAVVLGLEYTLATTAKDVVRLDELTTDDYVAVDGRELGWGEVTKEATLQLLENSQTQAVLIPVEVLATTESAVLARSALYDGEAGSLVEGQVSLSLLKVRDGQVARVELLDADDVDTAMAEFREQTERAGGDARWNRADELTRGWATTGDVAELLAPDVDFEDRRRIVAQPEEDRTVLAWMNEHGRAQHVHRVEPVAVRGDLLSLHRIEWRSDDGSDLEWELLTVAEFSEDGLPVRAIVFDADDLMAAVAELDRLYAETLDPLEAVRVLAAARSVRDLGENRVDEAMVGFHPDVQAVDHRAIGWGRLGHAELRVRYASLQEAGVSELLLERVQMLTVAGACCMQRARVGETVVDSRSLHVFGFDAPTGLLRSLDQYPPDDLARAQGRCRELDASSAQDLTNRAVWVGGAIGLAIRSRLDSVLPRLLGDEVGAAGNIESLGFGSADRVVVAVRDDNLALIDVGLDDGTRRYSVEEIDHRDRLVAVRQFGEDQLLEAMDWFDERFLGSQSQLTPESRRLVLDATEALRTMNTGALDALLTPDFELVDHRPLSFGRIGRDRYLAATDAGHSIADGVFLAREVHVINEDGFVISSVRLQGHRHIDAVESSATTAFCILRAGGMARMEAFPLDDVETAVLAFEAATSPREPDFWNEAHRLSTEILSRWTKDDGSHAELVADDAVMEDRRGVVGRTFRGKRKVLEALSSRTAVGVHDRAWSARVEPIAVRGEHLALAAAELFSSGSDSDGDVTFESLVVDQWDPTGTLQRRVVFEPDDVASAVAELDRLHMDSLDPVDALCFDECEDFFAAVAGNDVAAAIEKIDPDVRIVDHRLVGWPAGGFELWLERAQSLLESAESVTAVCEKYHRLSSTVTVFSSRYRTADSSGAAGAIGNLIVNRSNAASGYAVLQEQFGEEDLAAAMDRARELEAELTSLDTCHAVSVGGAANMLARSRRMLSLDGIVSPECVAERPDGHAVAVETQNDLRALGYGGPDRTAVAVRDDQLALIDMGLADGSRVYSVEEMDDQGRMVAVRQFGADELLAAADHLDNRWFERNPVMAPGNSQAILEMTRAFRAGDPLALAPYVADDFEQVDHRQLTFGGDRERWLSLVDLGGEFGTFLATVVHVLDDSGFVLSHAYRQGHAGEDDVLASVGISLAIVEDGRITRTETFADDQLDAALARFDELTRSGPAISADLVNRATSTAPDDVVAIRAEDHALLEVQADAGTALALVTVSENGEVVEERFALDDLPLALAALDRRYIDGLGPGAPKGIETFAAVAATYNPPDPEAMAALMAPDIRMPNHMSLFGLVASSGIDESLAVQGPINDGVQNVVAKVIHMVDHLVLCVSHRVVRREEGDRWITPTATLVRERDGLIDLLESWDIDELDAAHARFDELEAELRSARSKVDVQAVALRNAASDAFSAVVAAGSATAPVALPDVVASLIDDGSVVATPFAVWREHVALVELTGAGADDRRLALVECGDDQRLTDVRAWSWADADLACLALSDWTLNGPELSPVERAFRRLGRATNSHDIEDFTGAFAADAHILDHTPAGFGDVSREQLRDGTAAMHEMVPRVATAGRQIHRQTDHVLLSSLVRFGTSTAGADVSIEQVALLVADDAIRRFEMFTPEQLPDAIARFDELVAEADRSTPLQAEDNRSPELVNTMTGLFERSAGYEDAHVLAVRGDLMALVLRRASGQGEPGTLVIGVASPSREISAVEEFDPSDLAAACDRLNDVYLESLGDAVPACFPTLAEWASVGRDASQLDRLEAILSDDLIGESYESLGQLSRQNKSAMLEYVAGTADLPGLFITRKIHAVSDHSVVASIANVAGLDTGAITENLIVNHVVERDGQIVRLDQWEIDDLPAALARFDEAHSRSGL